MLKFKFGAWAVVFMLAVLSFSACDDNDDETYNPPANIIEALKQLYPNAQNVEWEMKGNYYVADCWVTGDESGCLVRCECQLGNDGKRTG